jgi:hypothetical protein
MQIINMFKGSASATEHLFTEATLGMSYRIIVSNRSPTINTKAGTMPGFCHYKM